MQKYLTKRNVLGGIAAIMVLAASAVYEFGSSVLATPTKTPEAAAAAKGNGADQKIDFTVASVKAFPDSSNGTVQALLNDTADFHQAHMTIVLKKGCGVATPAVGQHIVVTGQVSDYKGKPEVVVTSASQVKN